MGPGDVTAPAAIPVLRARGITKRFPGVLALADVSFELLPGEIHALCGENGAGKSTLIKLLSGIHPADSYEGELLRNEEPVHFRGTRDSQQAGIAVIYQELALVEGMTVAENIFLGAEPCRHGLVDAGEMHRRAGALLERFRVKIDPGAPCERLGIGEKQLVEIAKALAKNSRILILDEPTAALAEHEVQVLLGILRDLREQGISCIYISHKLDEVFALADRITVLRDGATISTSTVSRTSSAEVIRQMVGREIQELFPPREHAISDTVALSVDHLSVADRKSGRMRLQDISLKVHQGEVLGIGGLMGAGRTELLMHLFGAWGERRAGSVMLKGKRLEPVLPAQALQQGLALVTEDRRRYGLILDETIDFNLSLSSLGEIRRGGLLDPGREAKRNGAMSDSLRIKAPDLSAVVSKLSGGNQQKVVFGKALLAAPDVILLDEPTRGIDIGAKQEIYGLVNRLTASGKAVILVSSELPELIGMSDRILMLHDGRVGGEFTRADATPEKLLSAAMA